MGWEGEVGGREQSYKKPGSVVALQQEKFEKIMNLRKFLRKKRAFVTIRKNVCLAYITIVCKKICSSSSMTKH